MKHLVDFVEIGSVVLIGLGVALKSGVSVALIVVGAAIYIPVVIAGLRSKSDD